MLESETMLGKLSQCPPLFWGSTSTRGPRPNQVVGICPFPGELPVYEE